MDLWDKQKVYNIMISNEEIDMFKRPMHCGDIQNETIYIKDQENGNRKYP